MECGRGRREFAVVQDPTGLFSPGEKENRSPGFWNVVRRRLVDACRAIRKQAAAVPSPWGEGQGEGGRENKSKIPLGFTEDLSSAVGAAYL